MNDKIATIIKDLPRNVSSPAAGKLMSAGEFADVAKIAIAGFNERERARVELMGRAGEQSHSLSKLSAIFDYRKNQTLSDHEQVMLTTTFCEKIMQV